MHRHADAQTQTENNICLKVHCNFEDVEDVKMKEAPFENQNHPTDINQRDKENNKATVQPCNSVVQKHNPTSKEINFNEDSMILRKDKRLSQSLEEEEISLRTEADYWSSQANSVRESMTSSEQQ